MGRLTTALKLVVNTINQYKARDENREVGVARLMETPACLVKESFLFPLVLGDC